VLPAVIPEPQEPLLTFPRRFLGEVLVAASKIRHFRFSVSGCRRADRDAVTHRVLLPVGWQCKLGKPCRVPAMYAEPPRLILAQISNLNSSNGLEKRQFLPWDFPEPPKRLCS
jgi:hypothetical protein